MVSLDLACPDPAELGAALDEAVSDRVASLIGAQDPTLWGPDAQSEAAKRLSWVSLATTSRPLVDEIVALRDEVRARGLDHVVLCGMGGSSLAPEVICKSAGVELTVLDSSQPDMVRAAMADRLERSVVVVSSKSGGTVETDSQRRTYEQAFRDAGLDPADHLVIVTDPGSPLFDEATGAELARRGHDVEYMANMTWKTAGVCLVRKDLTTGIIESGADPRRPSRAMGR